MDGAAFDIAMANHDPNAFEEASRAVGFLGLGFYPDRRHDFMHIDLCPARQWSRRCPLIAPTFTPELPAPKPLAHSRTMKGGGAAGLATVGAAGIEVAQDVLADTLAAIQPLVPWLDTLPGPSSRSPSPASASPSTPAGMTGGGGDADMTAMIAMALAWVTGNRRALTVAKWGAIALTVLLFLLSIRRAGERAGRMAQRLENCNLLHARYHSGSRSSTRWRRLVRTWTLVLSPNAGVNPETRPRLNDSGGRGSGLRDIRVRA